MSAEGHAIRLRGGWDCEARDGTTRPLALPLDRWPDAPGPFRLIRRFGRPPIDVGRESLALRLGNVPGLREARLNGRPLDGPTAGESTWEVPIEGDLPARSVLELDVDPADMTQGGVGWGEVALVIRPR